MIKEAMKRNMMIDRLHQEGITHTKEGESIYNIDYDDLKRELALSKIREEEAKQIDIDSPENEWF